MGPPFLLSDDKRYLSATSREKILRVNSGIVTVAREVPKWKKLHA